MKRLLAVTAALCLLIACASAEQAPIASYELPQGAEVFYWLEASGAKAPEGLEGMYALMREESVYGGDLYLVRMPYGRAMVSIGCIPTKRSFTAEELLTLWPAIARDIGNEAAAVDDAAECAKVEELYGYPMLHIRTEVTLQDGLKVLAEGIAFCRDREIREVWAICPAEETYAAGTAEAEELEADMDAMAYFVGALSFPESYQLWTDGTYVQDAYERFTVLLPTGWSMLDEHAPQAEIDACRQRFVQANESGADRVFDDNVTDLGLHGGMLMLSEDMRAMVSICVEPSQLGKKMSVKQISQLAPAVQQMLTEKFDVGVCLDADDCAWLSGVEHSLQSYWIRAGEYNVLAHVMVRVDNGWFYEVDLFVPQGDPLLQQELSDWLRQTLQYHPPVNAFDE